MNMRISILLATLSFILVLFSSCNIAYAKESDIGQSQIHPAHPLYFLKTVREILELKFAKTDHLKVLRYLEFSTRRIREVNSLVAKNSPDLIAATLERYWINFDKLNGLANAADQTLMTLIAENISRHITSLEVAYSQVNDKRAKMAIRLTVNRLSEENIILMGKIKKVSKDLANLPSSESFKKIILNQRSLCDILVKQASESALNDVEKVVLKDRAEKCFDSLR